VFYSTAPVAQHDWSGISLSPQSSYLDGDFHGTVAYFVLPPGLAIYLCYGGAHLPSSDGPHCVEFFYSCSVGANAPCIVYIRFLVGCFVHLPPGPIEICQGRDAATVGAQSSPAEPQHMILRCICHWCNSVTPHGAALLLHMHTDATCHLTGVAVQRAIIAAMHLAARLSLAATPHDAANVSLTTAGPAASSIHYINSD
jgi:hypothetical protein